MNNYKRFLHHYYLFNVLAILAFIPIRQYYITNDEKLLEEDSVLGITRESSVMLFTSVNVMRNIRKAPTIDTVVGAVLLYSKLAILFLLFLSDARFFVWFSIVYSMLFVAIPKPKYNGPQNVEILNLPTFESQVYPKGNEKIFYLVMIYASWSDKCNSLIPLFAELSLKYTTKRLKFASIDVTKWSEISEICEINTSVTSNQLPSFILYQAGKEEIARLPPFSKDGTKKVIKTSIDREGLIAYFDLDKRFVSTQKKYEDKKNN